MAELAEVFRQLQSGIEVLELQRFNFGLFGVGELAQFLKGNRTLTALDLSRCHIGDEGVEQLAELLKENETLLRIKLEGNSIQPEGARQVASALKENSHITSLDLSFNAVGNEGAEHLAEALRVNGALTSLSLRCNQIGNAGAGRLADALSKNSTLTSLNVWGNAVGHAAAALMVEALEQNYAIKSFSDFSLVTPKNEELPQRIAKILQRNSQPQLILSLTLLARAPDKMVKLLCTTMNGNGCRLDVALDTTYSGLRKAVIALLDPELDASNRPICFVLPNGRRFRPGLFLSSVLSPEVPTRLCDGLREEQCLSCPEGDAWGLCSIS